MAWHWVGDRPLPKPMMIRFTDAYTPKITMTSSNGSIFCVTGPLWGEFTGHRWIPVTKASNAELWCFLWFTPEQTVAQTIDTPVIWDPLYIALIMMSLWWNRNVLINQYSTYGVQITMNAQHMHYNVRWMAPWCIIRYYMYRKYHLWYSSISYFMMTSWH